MASIHHARAYGKVEAKAEASTGSGCMTSRLVLIRLLFASASLAASRQFRETTIVIVASRNSAYRYSGANCEPADGLAVAHFHR